MHWATVGILVGFAPWIVYWVLVGNVPFETAVLVALGIAGIFLIALMGALIGKPFIREFAAAGRPDEVIKSELFKKITSLLTWIWIAAFAGMTVSSAIPPIMQGEATILDTKTPLSFVCYWVIPFAFMGLAALASRILPDKMTPSDDVVRESSFVAYSEAAIDELYYLAQEHANREVGAGKEAYDVKVGGMGIVLTGDDSRKSWPSTYRVRDRRH